MDSRRRIDREPAASLVVTLLRRSVPLSLLWLTAFATSASADCAWVLWNSEEMSNSPRSLEGATMRGWRLVLAPGSRNDCVRELARRTTNFTEGGWNVIVDGETKMSAWVIDSGLMQIHLMCLPDTVDPRGPRGK